MYAITLTKKNKRNILRIFDEKEKAIEYGNNLHESTLILGALSCIEADFDEQRNIVGGKYRLLHSW
jgi:hypothetical protein